MSRRNNLNSRQVIFILLNKLITHTYYLYRRIKIPQGFCISIITNT